MTAIDIILPYYNGSKYIKEQLESIAKSDTAGIELRLIIINDASSWNETEFLKKIMPSNVFYFENEQNLGVIKTVERGLEISKAQYIMLCDQDDVWLPQKIKRSLKKLQEIEKDRPALVYTDLAIVDAELEGLHPSMHVFYKHEPSAVYPSILFHNIVTGCTIIINRKLLEITLPFPNRVTMHDHWIAICGVFFGKISLLEEATILYRQHGGNQIGVPSHNTLYKLAHFKEFASKFLYHTGLKVEMAAALAERLQNHEMTQRAVFVKQVVSSIKQRKVIYLIRKKIIRGSLVRIIGQSILLLLNKK